MPRVGVRPMTAGLRLSAGPLDVQRDLPHWPNSAASRFVHAGGLRWHVQRMGAGPVVLLIHGTGASTHSWRALLPLLAATCDVVAMDLPGHAFTATPPPHGLALDGMAALVAALVDTLGITPALLVGHSAGAAVAMRMVLDGRVAPQAVVGLNAALFPLGGLAGVLFPPVAKLLALTPFAAHLFARRSWDRRAVEGVLSGTGSTLDAAGLALYGRLLADPGHAAGALGMMAGWRLEAFNRDLVRWATPLGLIVGDNDRAVPPGDAARTRRLLAPTTPFDLQRVAGAGHLLHEEWPREALRCVLAAAERLAPAALGDR
jgi:magnesium chelatase accessory protein